MIKNQDMGRRYASFLWRITVEEPELIRKAQQGDESAFAALHTRYYGLVKSICRKYLKEEQHAEDAVQSVFVNAWRGLKGFTYGAKLQPWIARIAVNESINLLRKIKSRQERLDYQDWMGQPEEDPSNSVPPDSIRLLEEREAMAWIMAALDQVDGDFRVVLELRGFQGLSYREIAEVLGIPQGTVMSRLHRGRQQLREVLGRSNGHRPVEPSTTVPVPVHATEPPPEPKRLSVWQTARRMRPEVRACVLWLWTAGRDFQVLWSSGLPVHYCGLPDERALRGWISRLTSNQHMPRTGALLRATYANGWTDATYHWIQSPFDLVSDEQLRKYEIPKPQGDGDELRALVSDGREVTRTIAGVRPLPRRRGMPYHFRYGRG